VKIKQINGHPFHALELMKGCCFARITEENHPRSRAARTNNSKEILFGLMAGRNLNAIPTSM